MYTRDDFEWDPNKAARNLTKHGVNFEDVWQVLNDPDIIEKFDEREDYGEERINTIGMSNGVIFHITYTERGKDIRLISARKANKYEQEDYSRKQTARRHVRSGSRRRK